jgi:voltage-gated potassium channel
VDARSERIARRFQPIIIVATLLVVPVLILEESDVPEPWPTIAAVGNWAIWLVFLAEVVVLLAVVPDRWRWVREHPLDLAIVILTPPFAASVIQSLRLLRLLRLVRLLRLAALLRGVLSLTGLRYAAFAAAVTVVVGGRGFASLEGVPVKDGLYWAMTTMTTVGYGDVVARTDEGRILAAAVMLVGIGFVAVLTGAIAEQFLSTGDAESEARESETLRRLEDVSARLDAIQAELRELRRAR